MMLKHIKNRCLQTKNQLFKDLKKNGYICENGYCYKDNENASFLLVAHSDTVQQKTFFRHDEDYIFSPFLDDRLGVALAVDVLPGYINCDILICDDEEIGNSTAENFKVTKNYRAIIELDRGGDDVVTYDLDSPDFIASLRDVDFKIGYGSYSDVCSLNTDICCVNVGIGFYKYHSKESFCVKKELQQNLKRLLKWCKANNGTKYLQEKTDYNFDENFDELENMYYTDRKNLLAMYGAKKVRLCQIVAFNELPGSCQSEELEVFGDEAEEMIFVYDDTDCFSWDIDGFLTSDGMFDGVCHTSNVSGYGIVFDDWNENALLFSVY